MERSTNVYSVHPVAFDRDIRCQRCDAPATHYLNSSQPIDNDILFKAELCESCAELAVNKLNKQTNWALME